MLGHTYRCDEPYARRRKVTARELEIKDLFQERNINTNRSKLVEVCFYDEVIRVEEKRSEGE